MLISDTHFIGKISVKIHKYTAEAARGGTAIIIKNSIEHHQISNYNEDFLQATSGTVDNTTGLLNISAVYLPPKPTVKQEQLEDFYNTLWLRFITGGDYNAKRTDRGPDSFHPEDAKYSKEF
jgi:hypothetical protein